MFKGWPALIKTELVNVFIHHVAAEFSILIGQMMMMMIKCSCCNISDDGTCNREQTFKSKSILTATNITFCLKSLRSPRADEESILTVKMCAFDRKTAT